MIKKSLKILVADDDNIYCIAMKKTLTSCGHTVNICQSGEDAINILKHEIFDIILLDYKMGQVSGIDVLQWMFDNKIDIPVILITGHGSEEVALEAWKWRANEYLIKGETDWSLIPKLVSNTYSRWELNRNS